MARRLVLILFSLLVSAGCASGVEPISIHDPGVPVEGRRLIADAEDGVAIARAKRDEAAHQLRRMEQWRRAVRSYTDWPDGSSTPVTALNNLVDSRVRLAQLRMDRAELAITLAQMELEMITARVAVRNDLAVYDLESLQERLERRQESAREIDRDIALHMERLDEVHQQWWSAYSAFVRQGGDATPFYPVFDRPI